MLRVICTLILYILTTTTLVLLFIAFYKESGVSGNVCDMLKVTHVVRGQKQDWTWKNLAVDLRNLTALLKSSPQGKACVFTAQAHLWQRRCLCLLKTTLPLLTKVFLVVSLCHVTGYGAVRYQQKWCVHT